MDFKKRASGKKTSPQAIDETFKIDATEQHIVGIALALQVSQSKISYPFVLALTPVFYRASGFFEIVLRALQKRLPQCAVLVYKSGTGFFNILIGFFHVDTSKG